MGIQTLTPRLLDLSVSIQNFTSANFVCLFDTNNGRNRKHALAVFTITRSGMWPRHWFPVETDQLLKNQFTITVIIHIYKQLTRGLENWNHSQIKDVHRNMKQISNYVNARQINLGLCIRSRYNNSITVHPRFQLDSITEQNTELMFSSDLLNCVKRTGPFWIMSS